MAKTEPRAGHIFKIEVAGNNVTEIEQAAMDQARECLGPDADLSIPAFYVIGPNVVRQNGPGWKKFFAVVQVYETLHIPST